MTAIGDVVYFGGTVHVVTAFTAGTSRQRYWLPIVSPPSEASVTFDALADALLASQAEVASGEANKLATAAIIKAFVEAHLPDLRTLIATNATPAAADRFFFTDENQTDDPLRYSTWFQLASSIVTDDRVLDLAQSSRSSADRGKFLGTSASNENDLDLLDAPSVEIADASITPVKMLADTAARDREWRALWGSSSIGLVANALPAVNLHNIGDTLIIGRGGATVVPFREIDAPSTELTATVAGDVMMLLAAGWSRVGNLFSGGIAAAAAQAAADAAQATADAATTVAEATTIADQRATVRYTDAEKTKLAGITNIFNPRGTFAVRTAYAVNDIVLYNDHLYYVAAAVPASNTANPVDGATWVLLSADPTPTATESRQGTVELATTAEMNAGTRDSRA